MFLSHCGSHCAPCPSSAACTPSLKAMQPASSSAADDYLAADDWDDFLSEFFGEAGGQAVSERATRWQQLRWLRLQNRHCPPAWPFNSWQDSSFEMLTLLGQPRILVLWSCARRGAAGILKEHLTIHLAPGHRQPHCSILWRPAYTAQFQGGHLKTHQCRCPEGRPPHEPLCQHAHGVGEVDKSGPGTQFDPERFSIGGLIRLRQI